MGSGLASMSAGPLPLQGSARECKGVRGCVLNARGCRGVCVACQGVQVSAHEGMATGGIRARAIARARARLRFRVG